jgi:hypothetical protein
MAKVDFTKEETQNLMVFLSRVDLKGGEVAAFVAVQNKITMAAEVERVAETAIAAGKEAIKTK